MHEDIREEIQLPENINAKMERSKLILEGPKGKTEREFPIKIIHEDRKLVMDEKNATKNKKRIMKTTAAHIKNMINGVSEGYEYLMQICSVHFPMNVNVQGSNVIIKNFLGESKERKSLILPDVNVKIENDIVKITSANKESAGQTAANIEMALRVKSRDRRIFQDGIWIIKKPGKKEE